MGRREKPLDPAAGPVQRFAYELRELRREAGGPTYRAMAKDTVYSAPTLSSAAAGERLPSLPVALAYAAACGGDRQHWEKRWREAVAEAAEEPAAAADEESAPTPGSPGTAPRTAITSSAAVNSSPISLTWPGGAASPRS
jgi:hypothetical protein